jgi:protein gp37
MNGMQKSGVPWADYRWNPIEGCSPVSEGCEKCYAKAMAHRFGRPWGGPVILPNRFEQPLHTVKRGRVFVCSTSDLFHEEVPREVHDKLFWVMNEAWRLYGHTFMLLTKRVERMRDVMAGRIFAGWLGVTGENQARYDERWGVLRTIRAVRHFVSVEPMLGPVTLGERVPDWIIAGPENGPGRRVCEPLWMANLEEECAERGVAFFDKREGEGSMRAWPDEGEAWGV